MLKGTLVLAFALLLPGAAIAQHKSGAEVATVTEAAPFQVVVYGAFRALLHKQDHAAKVQLRTAMQTGATEAVGAVSGPAWRNHCHRRQAARDLWNAVS
jgi:hypothetical protein